jgi:DNA-binding transcriptional regulator YhcF (GntR family)
MLEIVVDSKHSIPMYQQIVLQVKELIANNQYQPGYKMPTVRTLAAKLNINPATVDRAYQQLAAVGILLTGRRKGTVIISRKGQAMDLPISQSRLYGLVNVMISDTLTNGYSPVELEAALNLELSHWRFRREAWKSTPAEAEPAEEANAVM